MNVHDLASEFDRFVHHPFETEPTWLISEDESSLTAILDRSVTHPLSDDEWRALRVSANHVQRNEFRQAFVQQLTQQRVPQADQDRLLRNVRGLVLSATAAAAALRVEDHHGEQNLLHTAVLQVAECLGRRVREGEVPLPLKTGTGASLQLHDVFNTIQSEGYVCAAARIWSLFWLKAHREVEDRALTVPAAGWDQAQQRAFVSPVRFVRLEHFGVPELIEHPLNALRRLGTGLTASMERAWATAPPFTLMWRFEQSGTLWQDGDSLSGAAAVASHVLSHPDFIYQPGCIVLGAVGGPSGHTLEPVGLLPEKLEAAQQAHKNIALVGVSGLVGEPSAALGLRELIDGYRDRGLSIRFCQSVGEAAEVAAGRHPEPTEVLAGRECLERYILERHLETDGPCQIWRGSGKTDHEPRLLKLWPYGAEESAEVFHLYRTLWDRELRTMYRLSSTPGADDSLMKLREGGVDRKIRAFVMVLEAPGYRPLSELLEPARRTSLSWLRLSNLAGQRSRRAELWKALERIAIGIQLLHEQQVMHRNVCAERVYCAIEDGPSSFRLGGFEWSIRVGQLSGGEAVPRIWTTPPMEEGQATGYGFSSDWYAFGMLAARLFFPLEDVRPDRASGSFQSSVYKFIANDAIQTEELEHDFILQLIQPAAPDRLREFALIHPRLVEIQSALREIKAIEREDAPLLCIFSTKGQPLEELERAARLQGFRPEAGDPEVPFNERLSLHRVRLKDWMREDLVDGKLYRLPDSDPPEYRLKGRKMIYRLRQLEWNENLTWKAAAISPNSLPEAHGGVWCTELRSIPLRVAERSELLPEWPRSRSWEAYLPDPSAEDKSVIEWVRIEQFLRCTNQIELVMRQSEIYPYRQERDDDYEKREDGWLHFRIFERIVEGRLPAFCRMDQKMGDFFQRAIDMNPNSADERKIRLTAGDELLVAENPDEEWQIESIDSEHRWVDLKRWYSSGLVRPPREGFVRQSGHFGQIKLIERRLRAIERMMKHSYLMRALAQPQKVIMDVGERTLRYAPPPDKVDASKQAIVQDILRARPIYALLGPPGTGKTTLVAHLLREILQDDPSAQILVTAQAHGAVDVLRSKVTEEAFAGVPFSDQPIAVRLLPPPRGDKNGTEGEEVVVGSIDYAARELLVATTGSLSKDPPISDIGREWQKIADGLLADLRSSSTNERISSFRRLVQRAANIVYCTTSAGDLEDLDRSNQSFDWTIIEEAGKVHGYDLALPMRAGHRWLLLGDDKQLPPYRIRDFEDAIKDLPGLITHLEKIRPQNRDLVDTEWLTWWRNLDEAGQSYFLTRVATNWLRTFKMIRGMLWICSDEKTTRLQSIGAANGELVNQYRMHPDIGRLVSEVYYDTLLKHATIDEKGKLRPWVLHNLRRSGQDIRGKAVVWLDLPWAKEDAAFQESGPPNCPRYANYSEVQALRSFLGSLSFEKRPSRDLTLAILSPYNQQVSALNREFRDYRLPDGLVPQKRLSVRSALAQQVTRLAHTVDSFQGNQADIVVISLVRNNLEGPRYGMGFVKDRERMNVLISRAGRLLVLVGSFEFFRHQLSQTSPKDGSELDHWAKFHELLESMFVSGEAVRINYASLRGAK